jgi:hypothetical protein
MAFLSFFPKTAANIITQLSAFHLEKLKAVDVISDVP